MKEFAAFIGIFIILGAILVGASVFSLYFDRVAQPFAQETQRRTYENSVSRQEGVEQQISAYCMNLKTSTDPIAKKAFAHYIISEAGSYHGELSPEATDCLSLASATL